MTSRTLRFSSSLAQLDTGGNNRGKTVIASPIIINMACKVTEK